MDNRMEDPFYLRDQASRCSRLANNTDDRSLRARFLSLADEFTARAIAAESAARAESAHKKQAA